MRAYDDILYLPRPVSTRHPRMPRANRAAQFSPFAALTGYDAVIRETGRVTQTERELTEERKWELDRRLRLLLERPGAEVTVTWFCPDDRKEGGAYITSVGRVERLKAGVLWLENGAEIPVARIAGLEADLFWNEETAASNPLEG